MSRIAVIGAGAWGTGIAIVLGRGGRHQVRLWAHEKEVRDSISTRRENELFLPGASVPATFRQPAVCRKLWTALKSWSASCLRSIAVICFNRCSRTSSPSMLFVSATKGLEEETLLRMTEVAAQVIE